MDPKLLVVVMMVFAGACATENPKHKTHRRARQSNLAAQNFSCNLSVLDARVQRFEHTMQSRFQQLTQDVRSLAKNLERGGGGNHQTGNNLDSQTQLHLIQAGLGLLASDLEAVKHNISQIAEATSNLIVNANVQKVFDIPSTITTQTKKTTPSSCLDIKQNNPGATSSVYLVQPIGSEQPFMAYCDMQSLGGGWLTIHSRFTGAENFDRDWSNYKHGFGNIAGEHWLGLERVYAATGNHIHELLVQMQDAKGNNIQARYTHFSIGSEEEGYRIKLLGGYQGTAGDSLAYHAGCKFTTRDMDQDSWDEGNCAVYRGGAWWFKACDKNNLNGRYLPGGDQDASPMYWDTLKPGLKYAKMSIRPREP